MAIATDILQPLEGGGRDYDRLVERLGRARFVLIGEASHGTDEFYRERAAITRRLIAEKGFNAVAVEADWPDAYRVNRYVRGEGDDASADQALSDFKRFPAWMWRNDVVLDFVTWLRAHNESNPGSRAGFYGLDLYSLFTSIEKVIQVLDGAGDAVTCWRGGECRGHGGWREGSQEHQARTGSGRPGTR